MEYSLTFCRRLKTQSNSLNPYSNGILTDSSSFICVRFRRNVLILILMEYSLTYSN